MVDFILETLEYSGYIIIIFCVGLFAGRFIRRKNEPDFLEFFFDFDWKPKEKFWTRIGFLVGASFVFATVLGLEKRGVVPSPPYENRTESWKHLLFWQQILVQSTIYTFVYLTLGVVLRLLVIADVHDPLKSIFTVQWRLQQRWWLGLIKIELIIYAMIVSINTAFKL